MSLLLALALALLLSTTTDTLISNSYRASGEAFFAADGGVAVGRRAVARALAEEVAAIATAINAGQAAGYRSDSQLLPDSTSAPDAEFFKRLKERAQELANEATRSKLANGSQYQIEVLSFTGGPVVTSGPARHPLTGVENYAFTYTIRATGRSARAARAEVTERGELHTRLIARTPYTRSVRPLSAYGTLFDVGNPDDRLVLVSGVFTGPVHTNTRFNFSSRNNVVFRDGVTQVDKSIGYDGRFVEIPRNAPMQGINVSEGEYRQVDRVPLPKNNYSQELAALNGAGEANDDTPVDANGRPTPEALARNLSDINGVNPQPSGADVPPGVYISSTDGTSITGGGIYVNGDARIALSTTGSSQVIQITQGGTTTTITVDYTARQTVMSNGSTSRTFIGVPVNGLLGPSQTTDGISLFVDGTISGLSGPQAMNGTTPPAIHPETAMMITAQRHIRVTGDLKYTDPVVSPNGNPLPNGERVESVLGIFTNDGNVELAPDPSRTDGNGLSLEIDAAIAALDADRANNAGKLEGTIVYAGGDRPAAKARLKIVGCRIQSRVADIKYRNRTVHYDPRLADGRFAPPFFPGTEVKRSTTGTGMTVEFGGEEAVAIYADAWQRDTRRRKKQQE
jgi:hypothetical protein